MGHAARRNLSIGGIAGLLFGALLAQILLPALETASATHTTCSSPEDTISTDDTDNYINGDRHGPSRDAINVHDGYDVVYGHECDDEIHGAPQGDSLHGNDGGDELYGELGHENSTVCGDHCDIDRGEVAGGGGNDFLQGNEGTDDVEDWQGGSGDNDAAYGGADASDDVNVDDGDAQDTVGGGDGSSDDCTIDFGDGGGSGCENLYYDP